MFYEEGGLGPGQQYKKMNFMKQPTVYVGAMIVNFIRWVIDYVKVP